MINYWTFLKKLGLYSIISDLTCYDGEALCNEIPTLFGAIATAFPSPKKSGLGLYIAAGLFFSPQSQVWDYYIPAGALFSSKIGARAVAPLMGVFFLKNWGEGCSTPRGGVFFPQK